MKRLTALMMILLFSGCAPEKLASRPQRVLQPPAAIEDDIAVYFSPGGGAMAAILHEIKESQRTIDVQAYLMTAEEMVEALQAAQARGVKVRIVLDKHNIGGIYSYDAYLAKSGLPVWRDGLHKDAHDKIVLIDGQILITGSFNFTEQSEDTNGENLLVMRNKPKLFAAYQRHFDTHLSHSDPPK